jgi:hypothetical protein
VIRRARPRRRDDEVVVEGSPSLAVSPEDREQLEDLVAELLVAQFETEEPR